MSKFENAKVEMTLYTPESKGMCGIDEFHIELNDSLIGRNQTVLLAAGKSQRTTINKAIRTLKRLVRELEKEVGGD